MSSKWLGLALEAGAACRHPQEERSACPACAAQAIDLAVDVMMRGRVADAGPGERRMDDARRTRVEKALDLLASGMVFEDQFDSALRTLREESKWAFDELLRARQDVHRLSTANTELGLRILDLERELEQARAAVDELAKARALLDGIAKVARAMDGQDHRAAAIAAFAGLFATTAPAPGPARIPEEEVARGAA